MSPIFVEMTTALSALNLEGYPADEPSLSQLSEDASGSRSVRRAADALSAVQLDLHSPRPARRTAAAEHASGSPSDVSAAARACGDIQVSRFARAAVAAPTSTRPDQVEARSSSGT